MKANHHFFARIVLSVTLFALANVLAPCAAHVPIQSGPQISAAPPIPATEVQPRQIIPSVAKIQVVKASWYGRELAGHKTSSGEPYNPEALTAASRTLPLGTVVTVSNPQNGKSLRVRINDRGPFVKGRSLDLSHRAAKALGILHKGVTRVEIRESNPPSAALRRVEMVPQDGRAGAVEGVDASNYCLLLLGA
jgi:peptidoglycan lytic transglycosylase